jgi:NADH dehydrogenase FAD-containing subunit
MWETSPDSEADSSSFELAGHKPESLSEKIVVLGSGYAGTGAVKQLEHELDGKAEITWISDVDHQLVLYESHRCIRNPDIQGKITFSCEELKSESTRFINAHVENLDQNERTIYLDDAALVDQPDQEEPAPPTAQAAWQAAKVAGANLARTVHNQSLKTWTYTDNGTVISIGDDAVAHGIKYAPVKTFEGTFAEYLKKAIAARWLFKISGPASVANAWSSM